VSVESDAYHAAFATFHLDIRPMSIGSHSPVCSSRKLTPEWFVQFVEAIRVADVQVRELPVIKLAQ